MASLVYYSTNPSEWAQLEGLYIDRETPPATISGAALFTVGMAGRCVRGPETVQLIADPSQFRDIYGGRSLNKGGPLIGEIWKALQSKPFGVLAIRRVVASDAVLATHSFSDVTPTAIIRVDASSRGAWGNDLTVAIEAATDAVATHFNLRAIYHGREYLFQNLDTSTGNDNTLTVVGDDPATLVTVTKLANGRPLNIVATALTAGTDGALVDADYVTGIGDVAHYDGVAVVLVPETAPTQATLNGGIQALAAELPDRIFLVWSGVHGQTRATEITTKTTHITTPLPNLGWCFNSAKVVDPETGTTILVAPHTVMASIFSQNDVNIHPGAKRVTKQTAGLKGVSNDGLKRGDLILLRAAGIATLERFKDGLRFRTAVATNVGELADERATEWLLISATDFLAGFVDEENSEERRNQMAGALAGFSKECKDRPFVVSDFAVRSNITSDTQRAQNMELIGWDVRLIGHIGKLVLVANISTGTVVRAA